RALGTFDVLGLPVSQWLRQGFVRLTGQPRFPWQMIRRAQDSVGGHNGWMDVYGLMSLSKLRFFSAGMLEQVSNHVPYEDLGLDGDRMRTWHPLNRELGLGARAHLA